MKYVNAKAVLPHGLVEELQEYIQAGYIYIPAREDRHKAWGEQSGCRRELAERNAGIVDAYRQGVSLEELGDTYLLPVHSTSASPISWPRSTRRSWRCHRQHESTQGSRSARLPVFADLRS